MIRYYISTKTNVSRLQEENRDLLKQLVNCQNLKTRVAQLEHEASLTPSAIAQSKHDEALSSLNSQLHKKTSENESLRVSFNSDKSDLEKLTAESASQLSLIKTQELNIKNQRSEITLLRSHFVKKVLFI